MKLTLDLSEALTETLKVAGYTQQQLSDEACRCLAASMFERKVLSMEQAAQLAKMNLWEFIPFLGNNGIVVENFDEEESREEAGYATAD